MGCSGGDGAKGGRLTYWIWVLPGREMDSEGVGGQHRSCRSAIFCGGA